MGQVAEGLGKALSPVLGTRGAEGLGETEAAGRRWALQQIVAKRGRPGARPGFIPASPPQPLPVSPLPRPIRLQDSPSSRLREPSQLPRYLPCAPDPLQLEPSPTLVSPLPIRLPRSPPSGLPPALPRESYQALRASTEVLRGDRASLGGAPDRGVSALSTPRPLRAGTPKPFPVERSGFRFQKTGVLLQPRPPPACNSACKSKGLMSKIISYLMFERLPCLVPRARPGPTVLHPRPHLLPSTTYGRSTIVFSPFAEKDTNENNNRNGSLLYRVLATPSFANSCF